MDILYLWIIIIVKLQYAAAWCQEKNVALFGVLFGFKFPNANTWGTEPANYLLRISAMKPIVGSRRDFDGVREVIAS